MATNQQAATVESQPTDNTPSATTDWHNLYAGLDGLDGRVDPQQSQALKLLDSDPNPKEARARVINQGRLSEELKTMDPEMIRNNWQGVKDAYVKHAFGSNLKNVDDVTLYGMIAEQQKAQRAPKQAHDEQTYGIIRSPTAWEKISNGFDVYTHGLFHPALKPKMLHAEGVKSDWSDLPAMLGNMAGQTLLNPGNILTGAMLTEVSVAGSARKVLPEAYHAALRRFFTAQMIGQTSIATPGVAKEWMNPNVSGAQATADTIGLGIGGVMAGFGVAAEFVPKEAAAPVIEGIKDKIRYGEYRFSDHAVKRMIRRSIDRSEIEDAVMAGEMIEEYPDDKYSPSCLIYGRTRDGRDLHVQLSLPPSVIIITAYDPDESEWVDCN